MYYTLTGFCNYMNLTMTYTLTKSDGSALDSWMIFNPTSLTLQGLVPYPKTSYVTLKLTATETASTGTEYTISETFNVYYLSKPYLNTALPDFSIRTQQIFSYTIPQTTFI